MQSMLFFHVRHSSMSTPRNVMNFTLLSAVLSSKTFKIFSCFGRCHMSCTHYHEVCFTDNLFALNQVVTSSNSLFTISILLLISLCEYKMVVSSANNMKSSTFEVYVISFTYNIKRRGPNIEPCGTPLQVLKYSY